MGALLAFIIVFGLVVAVHEAGHYFAAKLAGIKVYEFSIGFGPTLTGFSRKGTWYGLNLFPLGGLVRLAGLDDSGKDKSTKQERYTEKSWGSRVGVLIAGPLMNILLGFVIFVIVFSFLGIPQKPSTTISEVFPGSPANKAGWVKGDILKTFQGEVISDMSQVITLIHQSQGQPLFFLVEHKGEQRLSKLIPTYYPEKKLSLVGIKLVPTSYKKYPPLAAGLEGLKQTYVITHEVFKSLSGLLTGRERFSSLTGPIGIAKLSGEAAAQGSLMFLYFIAMLSINLGILNLLPIPAFDGGRLMFLVIEKVIGKKISIEKEQIIHYLGFAFLLTLMIIITFFDVRRIFNF